MKISKNIKAVIFDMDGLLIDSEPYWQKADRKFFSIHNKKFSEKVNHKIMGMGHREIMEYFIKNFKFPNKRDELITQRKELLYKHLLNDLVLMQGAEKLIQKLHKKGFILAIATSGHKKEMIEEILKKLKIDSYFSTLVSGDDVKKSKPAPDIYLKTSKLLNVDPEQCLVLEDAPNGVVAGRKAGMTVCGVNEDEYFQKELKNAGADVVFRTLSEINI